VNKLKALWASLPHVLQAGIVTFTAASAAYLGQALSDPSTFCVSPSCLHKFAAGAIAAGVVALRAFYMTPSNQAK
jgi:hypothetical protein